MKKKPNPLLALATIVTLLPAASSLAATIVVTDGDSNNYGNFDGFALDFDATPQGTNGVVSGYNPPLQAGEPYSLDSISLFERNNKDAAYYLGVYTGYDAGALSGFQGVSTNTINFNATTNEKVTWLFSPNQVVVTPETNPGAGSDIRYFILQTGTDALTTVPNQGPDDTAVKRLDGESGSFAQHLGAVIDVEQGLRRDRVAEYEAVLTPVPEPSAAALLGVGALALLRRRRA